MVILFKNLLVLQHMHERLLVLHPRKQTEPTCISLARHHLQSKEKKPRKPSKAQGDPEAEEWW